MNTTLSNFQRRFPAVRWPAAGSTWLLRDTDQDADRIPLVMLPGAGGTGDVFYHAMDALRTARRVVSVTYPDLEDADRLASGLLQALASASIETFDLFGSSLGGYLAQVCALQEPSRIRRLMLGNTFFDAAWLQRKINREQLRETPPATHLANTLAQLRGLGDETPEKADYKQTMLMLVGGDQTAEMAKAALLAVLGTRPVAPVPLGAAAIAVLDAEDDPVVDAATREAMRDRYQGSRLFALKGGGHYPSLLSPAAFIDALEQHFVEG